MGIHNIKLISKKLIKIGKPSTTPGITSSISVPAYAGIPVTHRGITCSFRVVTGHEAPNKKDTQINWEQVPGRS